VALARDQHFAAFAIERPTAGLFTVPGSVATMGRCSDAARPSLVDRGGFMIGHDADGYPFHRLSMYIPGDNQFIRRVK
jgi:hypothetical protein